MSLVTLDDGRLDWEYLGEGGANLILRYSGQADAFRGCVLRLRKGGGSRRQLEEDCHFQSLFAQLLAP